MKSLFLTLSLFLTFNLFAQPAGYAFGKQILIKSSQVSGTKDLTDFTVLVSFTDPDLRSVSNGGKVESIDGYDITFTTAQCSESLSVLDYQVEKYEPTTGELVAWVKIPKLSSTVDYNLHMYYGNAAIATDPSTTDAWLTDYEGVWHMNNDPSSVALSDYTGNGVDGTSSGAMTSTDLVTGKIGPAMDFDGTNDFFALASKSYTTANSIKELSISAWVNTTHVSNGAFDNWSIIDFDRSEFFNMFIHGNGTLGFGTSATGSGISDSYAGTVGDLNDGAWHHVAGVYDGKDKLLYIDGVLALTVSNPHGGLGLGKTTTRFGFIGDGSEATTFNGSRNKIYYDGQYDEVRFAETTLSGDWIKTEYNNQNAPASFYTVSSEFAATNLCAVLPVELVNLTANYNDNDEVVINWQTATEINNDFFTIERSINGEDWEIVTILSGAGNSSALLSYSDFDNEPHNGTSYYRLKQTDFDGQFEYSKILTVNNDGFENVSIEIYPNPAHNQITIVGNQNELKDIEIYNIMGQNVNALTNIITTSDTKMVIDFSQLVEGIYFVKSKNTVNKVYKK